jgi:hypothetical protein
VEDSKAGLYLPNRTARGGSLEGGDVNGMPALGAFVAPCNLQIDKPATAVLSFTELQRLPQAIDGIIEKGAKGEVMRLLDGHFEFPAAKVLTGITI